MPHTEQDLKQHMKSSLPQKAYLLYGEESYLTSHYSRKLIDWICGDELTGFDYQEFEGDEVDFQVIAEALLTIGWGTERKCVCVKELRVSDMNEDVLGKWLEFLADLPDDNVLLVRLATTVVDQKNSKWKKFIQAFEKAGEVFYFPIMKKGDCAKTLCNGAKKRKVELPTAVANALIDRCGMDLRYLINELEKLCAIAGEGGTITENMLQSATTQSLESVVFDLSKMIMGCNATRAFTILRGLQNKKEKPLGVLAILGNTFIDLYRTKIAKEGGLHPEELAQPFGYASNRVFVLTNAGRTSAKIPIEDLRAYLNVIAEADTTIKSTNLDPWLVLDNTVTKLLQIRRKE